MEVTGASDAVRFGTVSPSGDVLEENVLFDTPSGAYVITIRQYVEDASDRPLDFTDIFESIRVT